MMERREKVVVASQHYLPDRSTTAAIMSAIAAHLATQGPVLVLSGTTGSRSAGPVSPGAPTILEIKNWMPGKGALLKRAIAEVSFTLRTSLALLLRLRRGDVVLTVTAPFMLPYAVVAAAKLRRARSVLIMHDLYPDVLVMADLLQPASIATKAIHGANALMFRALDAVVIIGRNTQQLLSRYSGVTPDKIHFIPNWGTLPPAVRPLRPANRYRRTYSARFVVGLSGNLGFTHDPIIVFEVARLLQEDPDIHFLLSGWGIGFGRLKEMQFHANLPNVTLVNRVEDEDLEEFLSAANVWLIPYRKNAAGLSVPSRFYNILAVGRPVILVSEPDAEAAVTVIEHDVGWVVTPGKSDELARAIRLASLSSDPLQAERAATIAQRFNFAEAMASYSLLVQGLLRKTQ
jgi:colanic acid biosynthesis glycosyl transferase WcaI